MTVYFRSLFHLMEIGISSEIAATPKKKFKRFVTNNNVCTIGLNNLIVLHWYQIGSFRNTFDNTKVSLDRVQFVIEVFHLP